MSREENAGVDNLDAYHHEVDFSHLLNHPLLTRSQEFMIFSIGQNDALHPAGTQQRLSRDTISTKDLRNHPLFPSFIEEFSPENKARSVELLGISGTLSEYIILHNQKRVQKIAREFRGKGLSDEDLFQEGNIGLARAITKFDPERESAHTDEPVAFSTFSTKVIRNSLNDAIRRRWKTDGLPLHLYHAVRIYSGIIESLRSQSEKEPTKDQVRRALVATDTLAPEIIELLIGEQLTSQPLSLNQPVILGTPDDGYQGELQDRIPSLSNTEEEALANLAEEGILAEIFPFLPPNSVTVLALHRGLDGDETLPLRKIARHFGVSHEKVRQWEWIAIEGIKAYLIAQERGQEFTGEIPETRTYPSHFREEQVKRIENRKKMVQALILKAYTPLEVSAVTGCTTGQVRYAISLLRKTGALPTKSKPDANQKEIAELLKNGRTPVEAAMKVNKPVSAILRAKRLMKAEPGKFEALAERNNS